MLNFRRLTTDDADLVRPFFSRARDRVCNHTLVYTMCWRDYLQMEFAIVNNSLLLQSTLSDGEKAFSTPLGGALEDNMQIIERYCRGQGRRPRFFGVPSPYFQEIAALYPGLKADAPREFFDYIYKTEDLAFYRGKRFAGQRNHCNRFQALYPEWRYEDLTSQNLPLAKKLLASWTPRSDASATAAEEFAKTAELLEMYQHYHVPGGLLTASDGQAAAFCVGEQIGDTFFVQAEKADRQFQGAYQMVVRECARRAGENGAIYCNRGEDDGVEGMRTSKLSYHPIEILEKYDFTLPERWGL